MATILYSTDSSYYSMIARLVLAEKNVPYTLHKIDIHIKMEQFNPEYVKIQPNMTVPVLASDQTILDDSRAILMFVNKHFSGSDLFPENARLAIEQSLDLHYGFSIEDLTMGNALRKSPIAKLALRRGLDRASRRCHELMRSHPEFKEACEKKLELEEERKRLILSKDNNYNQVYQRAIDLCDILEQQLTEHQFAVNNKYTLADVVWTVFLARLYMIKLDNLITSRKNLNTYWQKMKTRKSFVQADIWTKMHGGTLLKIMFALLFKR